MLSFFRIFCKLFNDSTFGKEEYNVYKHTSYYKLKIFLHQMTSNYIRIMNPPQTLIYTTITLMVIVLS